MLASLACAHRRLACRHWAGRVALRENCARPHIVSRLQNEVKRALRCARRAPWPAPGAALLGTARLWRGILPSTHLAREGRMTVIIGRRELLAALGGAAAAWPLAARAQQPAMPAIGFLSSRSSNDSALQIAAFHQALGEAGFVEGRNVAIDYRWADGQYDRLPGLAADLVGRQVAVIFAGGPAAHVAKAATTTIPIVFVSGEDPVEFGLVASLNRPGGNVTGVLFLAGMLGANRLELRRRAGPAATTIAVLVNPDAPDTEAERREVQGAAQTIGQQLIIVDARSDADIETAFATFVEGRAGALLVGTGAFMLSHRERVVALAARHAIPAMHSLRESVDAGGLMSYAPSITDAYHQTGVYAGRILKGEKPADLPVMQSIKFAFVINLKTAKALGLHIPDKLLALADEVIE